LFYFLNFEFDLKDDAAYGTEEEPKAARLPRGEDAKRKLVSANR